MATAVGVSCVVSDVRPYCKEGVSHNTLPLIRYLFLCITTPGRCVLVKLRRIYYTGLLRARPHPLDNYSASLLLLNCWTGNTAAQRMELWLSILCTNPVLLREKDPFQFNTCYRHWSRHKWWHGRFCSTFLWGGWFLCELLWRGKWQHIDITTMFIFCAWALRRDVYPSISVGLIYPICHLLVHIHPIMEPLLLFLYFCRKNSQLI